MEMEILEKKQNAILNRAEVKFKITHAKEPSPNRDAARDKLALLQNVKKEQVIVDSLDTTFGKNITTGYAKVYPDKETAMKVEREYQLVRNKLKEKAKKSEQKAEEKPAEKKGAPKSG